MSLFRIDVLFLLFRCKVICIFSCDNITVMCANPDKLSMTTIMFAKHDEQMKLIVF